MLTKPKIQPCSVFQSTLPCGSELQSCNRPCNSHGISIRTPSRERLARRHKTRLSDAFQSTLPHGSDDDWCQWEQLHQISIHAPLRERQRLRIPGVPYRDFNSRSLVGATEYIDFFELRLDQFQSTLPCGSDSCPSTAPMTMPQFQSTLPCGSDQYVLDRRQSSANFNPRSLAGATQQPLQDDGQLHISIHAPLRERPKAEFAELIALLFQSTLPCGSDPRRSLQSLSLCYFNPRSLAGATIYSPALRSQASLFQSTLPHGSDAARCAFIPLLHLFQSTLPHGSDLR